MPKEYRGRIAIIHDILHAINNETGIGTTRLLFLSNLSHERLMDYLSELRTKELIAEAESSAKKAYQLTDKGHRFLAEVRRVRSLMADFGLDM
ncbi:MAG TPA: winged helix-turn-helix domain-containing protein [Candidatus Thermoplasmatota archaeon]|nr:winged helix-turn-helix domain-containing protein [Candidatus Thermoplasmatota archaeon]